MSNDTTFHMHIARLAAQCRRMASWILRSFRTRDRNTMLLLWKTFVLSRLDYCSQLWSPQSVKLTADLEVIQRHYTKRIHSVSHLGYWERLKELRLLSLERRRERYTVLYVWKILEGLVPNFGIDSCSSPRTGRRCIVPKIPSSSSRMRTQYCNSLGFRGPQLFNALPQRIRDLRGVDISVFKASLDNFLTAVPDEPTPRGESRMRAAATNSLLHQMHYWKKARVH